MDLEYGMKSGDPNTSISNTFINAICFNHVFRDYKMSKALILGDDN
jgi:hypothetical protein